MEFFRNQLKWMIMNGITSRIDSYEQSESHRLQSIMEVHVSNLFVAETISDRKPIKMIGEWNNDYEHPRDTRFGTLMLNMATWRPTNKITNDNKELLGTRHRHIEAAEISEKSKILGTPGIYGGGLWSHSAGDDGPLLPTLEQLNSSNLYVR